MTVSLRHSLPHGHLDAIVDETLGTRRRRGFYRTAGKRLLDVSLVLIAAIPVLLLLTGLCLLIMADGHSPIYRQKRVGKDGKIFSMIKLRSMVPNADRQLEAYLAANKAARSEWNRTQKLRHDPRITPVGRLIRKTSLDELPQLWNVLKGDMSLVGPRPMMVEQQALYPGTAYFELRPGVTGFWQISVRNLSSFVQRADFDAAYLREVSFLTDLKVLVRTVFVVLKGTGC